MVQNTFFNTLEPLENRPLTVLNFLEHLQLSHMVHFDRTWVRWKYKQRNLEDSFSESYKNVKGFVLTNLFCFPHTCITYKMQKWEEKWGQLLQEACLCGYFPALEKSEARIGQNEGTRISQPTQQSMYTRSDRWIAQFCRIWKNYITVDNKIELEISSIFFFRIMSVHNTFAVHIALHLKHLYDG